MGQAQTDNKRIAKNTLFLYFRTFIIMLISLYTSRAVLDALGETDFGIYNLVGGIVVLFAFMNSAMSSATQRYLNFELGRGNEDGVSRIFSMSINVHIGIAALVLILGESIGLWFVMTQLNIPAERYVAAMWVYHLSLIGCCINILRIPYNACIIAYERMSFYAYVSVIEAILKLAIVFLLLVTFHDKLIEYALYMTLVIGIVNALYMVYCHRNFQTSHYVRFWDKDLFKKLMSFSGWSMFGSLATVGTSQGISILLNVFYGVTLNAAIGLANQVQSAVTSFVSSFQTAFSPQIVKTYAADQKKEFVQLICRSSRLSYCLVFIFAPALMVCIKYVLQVWLTIVPDYTAEFVCLFIVYCMIDAASGPLWVSVQASGQIKRYQLLMSILILSNLPIMLLLLYIGISPVLVVSVRVIINLITHFARILYLKKSLEFPVSYYMKDVMGRIFLMTIVSLPLTISFYGHANTLSSAMLVFFIIVSQNCLLSIFMGLTSTERTLILDMIKSKLRYGKDKSTN